MTKWRWHVDQNTLVLAKRIVAGVLVLLVCAGIVYGIHTFTRTPAFTISAVEVSGGETISHDMVRAVVETELEGSYLKLVPRRFTWWYPKEAILSAVAKVSRIHNVSLYREDTTLKLTFDEYLPYALWCDATGSAQCVFLDDTGYAFAVAPQLSGGSFLRFIKTDEVPDVGVEVFSGADLQTIRLLVDLLAERHWYTSYVEVDQVGDMFLSLAGGGELKVTTSDDPVAVVDNLFVVLGSETFSHLKPGNFQYIDLRFGEKVFINERGDSGVPESGAGVAQ